MDYALQKEQPNGHLHPASNPEQGLPQPAILSLDLKKDEAEVACQKRQGGWTWAKPQESLESKV